MPTGSNGLENFKNPALAACKGNLVYFYRSVEGRQNRRDAGLDLSHTPGRRRPGTGGTQEA